jgi:hypothetical protein
MPSAPLSHPHIGLALAVLGNWHPGGAFVSHASLLQQHGVPIFRGFGVRVTHMRPPIDIGDARHFIHPVTAPDVIGWVEDLTDAERAKMLTWLAEVSRIMEPFPPAPPGVWLDEWLRHYILLPPVQEQRDVAEDSGPYSYRFSCVGLVLACYRQAKIDLLDTENTAYPKVFLNTLTDIYGQGNILAPHNLHAVGLSRPQPWPVPLPGHLFHALSRPAEEIRRAPYLPREPTEVYFPSRPADPLTAAEHTQAEVEAYYIWERRGGHGLPYDPALADEDFRTAATTVTGRRPPIPP